MRAGATMQKHSRRYNPVEVEGGKRRRKVAHFATGNVRKSAIQKPGEISDKVYLAEILSDRHVLPDGLITIYE